MPTPTARFDELAVLVAVAESGSIAAAARRLAVPKSTVGRAIKRLEDDLGAVLVRRMTAGPSLTDHGRTLATLAAPHVAALRDVTSSVAEDARAVQGSLRITAPVDVAQLVLGPLVASFVARHPGVHVDVEASVRVVDLAGEGVDLAIRVARKALASSTLVAKKLAKLDLGFYAGTAYVAQHGAPRRPEDLANHPNVMLFGRDGRTVLALDGPRGATKVAVRGRVSGNDFSFMREAIVAGAGVGPLSSFVATPELAAGRIVRVLPDWRLAGMNVYLVHPPVKPLPRKVELFRAHLVEHAPRLLLGG